MTHVDRELKKGEVVEVSVADDRWVLAEVLSDMETRVSVRLLHPIVWVEDITIINVPWIRFLKPKIVHTTTSKWVETMTVSCLLIRLPQ